MPETLYHHCSKESFTLVADKILKRGGQWESPHLVIDEDGKHHRRISPKAKDSLRRRIDGYLKDGLRKKQMAELVWMLGELGDRYPEAADHLLRLMQDDIKLRRRKSRLG